MADWTASDIPSQRGRTAIITGTGGLGFEAALALARAGAKVVLAGRNVLKGYAAVDRILREVLGAQVRFELLDLASLASVEDFAARMACSVDRVDLLINNAAVMAPPRRELTTDGFELQFGTNYLGHFALTAHLLPLLCNGVAPRVVSLSSVAARSGAIRFDDLQSRHDYKAMQAYGQSKLACLMFAFELQRRSEAGGWGLRSIAAHPGIARTDLLPNGAGAWSGAAMARSLLWFLFQPAAQGALPTLFAATAPEARGGAYYGPDRLGETRGHPVAARVPDQALVLEAAARLWNESERLSAVDCALAPEAAMRRVI